LPATALPRSIDAQVFTAMFGPAPTCAPTAGAFAYVSAASVQSGVVLETSTPSAEVA